MIDQADIEKAVRDIVQRDGVCTPGALVNEARNPSHPLHGGFDWDNHSAAEDWRKHQARQLIARVRIITHERPAPAFVSARITVAGERKQGYLPTEQALSIADVRRQVTKEARLGLAGWAARLAGITEAAGAIALIDQAVEALTDGKDDDDNDTPPASGEA